MSIIYPQMSKPGGFGMGLCARIYSPAALATPTCFCIYRLWQNPVCPSTSPHPHRHPSVWMHSTSRSSICFCPPMKRPIIICRMHSWRAASSTWAGQCIEFRLWIQQALAPPPSFILIIWAPCLRSSVEQVFLTTLSPSSLAFYKSSHSEWISVRAQWMMAGSWLTLEWLANVIEGGPPGCRTVQSAATEGPE